MTETTDNRTYGTSPEPSRCEHVQRTLCRSDACAPGKAGLDGRGTGGENGTADSDPVQLGEHEPVAGERRSGASCEGTRSEYQESLAEGVSTRRSTTNINTCLFVIVACVLLQSILVFIHVVTAVVTEQRLKELTPTLQELQKSSTISHSAFFPTFSLVEYVPCHPHVCLSEFDVTRVPSAVVAHAHHAWILFVEVTDLPSHPLFPKNVPSLPIGSSFPGQIQKNYCSYTESIGNLTDTIHTFSLNKIIYATDNQTYESPSPQRSRYQHLLRQVCGAPAGTAGQNRNDNTGTRRENQRTFINGSILGWRNENTASRQIPCSCGSPRRYGSEFDATEVNYHPALPVLIPVFLGFGKFSNRFIPVFLGQRNSAKFYVLEFPMPNRFSGEISENFPKFYLSPIANLLKVSYNRGITNGKYPVQKRLTKVVEHFGKPDSKPIVTRFTAGLDCIRKGISCKRFIATKGRTAL